MEKRLDLMKEGKYALGALQGLGMHLAKSSLPQQLLHLLYYRVSQINGCAYCLDMHSKDLLEEGENAQRLFVMAAWRDTPFFSDKERAALAWAEAVTKLSHGEVPQTVYDEAAIHFNAQQLIDLTLATIAINSYNRLNISFPPVVGGYVPGMFAPKAEAAV